MKNLRCLWAALAVCHLGACADGDPPRADLEDFERLLDTLAEAWGANDAERAASVFAPDAVYAEPPDKQLYVGREKIFEFFGGAAGRDTSMAMAWHNVSLAGLIEARSFMVSIFELK